MEMAEEKITIGMALLLNDIVTALLFSQKKLPNGEVETVERNLPFRLRYRLNRNKLMLDRDVRIFADKKLLLLAKYGTPNAEGNSVEIKTKEAYDKYQAELSAIFDTEVSHSIIKLDKTDIDFITDGIPISNDALSLFSGYMMDDPELYEDLIKDIEFKAPEWEEIAPKEEKEIKEPKVKKDLEKVETTSITSKKTPSKKTTATKKKTVKTK